MTRPFEGARAPLIPMTPDCAVLWTTTSVDTMKGKLYVAPHCTIDMVEAVQAYASPDSRPDMPQIGTGDYGTVYQDGNLAVKVYGFEDEEDKFEFGLDNLRANVGLSSGLSTGKPLVIPKTGKSFAYRGPEYFCAFLPDSNYGVFDPVWLMSHEAGRTPDKDELPPPKMRAAYLARAMKARGFNPADIDLDDAPYNTLIDDVNCSDQPVKQLVKLDLMVNSVLKF